MYHVMYQGMKYSTYSLAMDMDIIYQLDRAPPRRAPVHDLAVVDEVRHGADDLLDGAVGVVLVYEHEVDVVHLKVPQRLLHRFDYLFARQRTVLVPESLFNIHIFKCITWWSIWSRTSFCRH